MTAFEPVGRKIVKVSRSTIAEAKLRMTLDKALGRKSNPVVQKIAAAKPPQRSHPY